MAKPKKNRHLITWVEKRSAVIEVDEDDSLETAIREQVIESDDMPYSFIDDIEITGQHCLESHVEMIKFSDMSIERNMSPAALRVVQNDD